MSKLNPVQLNKPITRFNVTAKEPSWVMPYHRRPRNDLKVELYCTFIPANRTLEIVIEPNQNLYLVRGNVHVEPILDSALDKARA